MRIANAAGIAHTIEKFQDLDCPFAPESGSVAP
jgi:hypothetical protein